MLLFVLPGLLLFRFAERQLFELLFQLPPRMTRLGPRGDRTMVAIAPEQPTAGQASKPANSAIMRARHPRA
jgi:hypothetical protein